MNYYLKDVAQVYRVYMIWELALNVAMCMERIIIVLLSRLITVDVRLYVIVECPGPLLHSG